jgi:hypothetical protein
VAAAPSTIIDMQLAGLAILILAAVQPDAPIVAPSMVHRIPQIRVSASQLFAKPDRHPEANETRLFTCPKDGAQLKVPAERSAETFTCPVDGTEMKASKPAKKFLMLER